MSCLICERIEMIKNDINPYFVKELDTGYVVLGDHQHFYGYTLFLSKIHATELHYLEREVKLKFLKEMAAVNEAVHVAFDAEKMNCELLGNGDAHLHWHLFPRRKDDMPIKGPVWWLPREEMWDDSKRPSDAELIKMKQKLLTVLDDVLLKNED